MEHLTSLIEYFSCAQESSSWPGKHRQWPSIFQSDAEGGEMAATTLSPQTIGEMVRKLGGLALSPSELEELAPHLETLFSDLQTLASVDLGEVEPETLFDVQGE
jgi:hypothetical protein